jgi:hypothetical protein
LYVHVITGWPAIAGARDPIAKQLLGWNAFAAQAESARQSAGADYIAAEPYGVAAELAWALPTGANILGAGSHWASIQLPRPESREGHGILIRPERYGSTLNPEEWRDVTRMPVIARTGGNGEIERYAVFLVRPAEGRSAGVLLPRR